MKALKAMRQELEPVGKLNGRQEARNGRRARQADEAGRLGSEENP